MNFKNESTHSIASFLRKEEFKEFFKEIVKKHDLNDKEVYDLFAEELRCCGGVDNVRFEDIFKTPDCVIPHQERFMRRVELLREGSVLRKIINEKNIKKEVWKWKNIEKLTKLIVKKMH